jgi:hypothetical protein
MANDGMTEQMRILTKRLKEAPAIFRRLNRKLVKVGGRILLVHPGSDNKVAEMVFHYGESLQTVLKKKKMTPNECHHNTAKLWKAGKLDAICLGYGLSDDGLWREHYWGIKDDRIVETTVSRIRYFSVIFRGKGGDPIANWLSEPTTTRGDA